MDAYVIVYEHALDRSAPIIRSELASGPCSSAVHLYWFRSDAEKALSYLANDVRQRSRIVPVTLTVFS